MIRYVGVLLPVLLSGCGPEPESNATESIVLQGNADELIVPAPAPVDANLMANVAESTGKTVTLAEDGLRVPAGHASFGTPRALATKTVADVLGNPIEQGDDQECGAGALSFASFRGGLGLYFRDGKFVGWDVDGRDGGGFATAAGVGIGATRARLEAAGQIAITESTLGIEFSAGRLSGLLSARDPDGEVTNLWAGTTCIAR